MAQSYEFRWNITFLGPQVQQSVLWSRRGASGSEVVVHQIASMQIAQNQDRFGRTGSTAV